jgi:hypothetical protein
LGDHLGLVATGAIAALAGLKLLRVAHDDPSSAAAILQHAGTANVAFGVALSSAAFLLVAGAVAAFLARDPDTPPYLAIFIAGILVFFAPIIYVVVVPLLIWVAIALRKPPSSLSSDHFWFVLTPVAVVGVAGFIGFDSMWMPHERVTVGERTYVGFVLSSSPDETALLLAENREVRVMGPATARRICEPGEPTSWVETISTTSLLGLMFWDEKPDYPTC